MSKTGDDCHFFYSSTCTKGGSCPFRHVEAARNSAIVCNFWKQKKCTKPECPYRHSNVKSKTVPCYWENQPNGCSKADCVFQHFKPRPGQDGQTYSGMEPLGSEPIIVNPAEDSSDMDSPKKKPPNQNVQSNDGNQDGETSGVQQIAVIIQPTRSNQMHRAKTFGHTNITPWKRSPFQQHMHKQQLMQQRKRQFQQRQQQHIQGEMHQIQQEEESTTTTQIEQENDESQSDTQQQQEEAIEPQAQTEIKKTEKQIIEKDKPSEEKKPSTSAAPVKKVIRLKKDPKKEKVAAPEPKKELPKIKKIIKKVVHSSDDEAEDELGIKSLEQTLRERALRSMGIVEILVKKDENKQSDKDEESEGEDNDDVENSGSEKEETDENEEESEGEQSVEEEAGSEEAESEEGEEAADSEEGGEEEEEAEEEDDLQDPEEIEILPVDDVDQIIGVDEEQQDEGEDNEGERENQQEDTRKAVKKARSKKDKPDSKKRDSKRDKLKKKHTEKQGTDVGKSGSKRTVLDRLGKKLDSTSGTSDKSERANVGARKSGNIIKLRRSSKSREELKLISKNRIRPEDNDIPSSAIGSTNAGTIRLTSRVGDRNTSDKPVRKSASQSNIKSRLGWNRPSDRASDTPSENSEYSDSETQKQSVKNRIGWKNRDNDIDNDDVGLPVNKDTKRKHSKSRKSRKRDKKDRYSEDYDSSEPSDSDSESELREKARKLKKLIDFDSDTIEDILRARERKKKSKSKKKRRRREEEKEESEDSDVSQEGDQRLATISKSRERNIWGSKRRTGFVDEDLDPIPVIPNKVPSSKPIGITFQVKNDLVSSSRQLDQFTVDNKNSDSDEDDSTNQLQDNLSLKRGWTKSAAKEEEVSDEAKKPKINRIQWGTDDKAGSEVVRSESSVTTVVRPVATKSNVSWSTRAPGNVRIVTGSKMEHLDEQNKEKVKRVQIKSLDEIRKEKAQKYISDDSSEEELDPMEALRQKFNVKSSAESARQKNIDAKRRARQAQQIYVPPPRKRTVQLAFDDQDGSKVKKERVASPVESQTENRKRVSPLQFDVFDNKAQSSSKSEVKTFAEIMAEKRARAKQLRDQSSKGENPTQSEKSTKSFRPIVFDIDAGASKSVSPMNRFVGTDRVSPVPATTAVNIEKDHQNNEEEEKSHKSHKHHHKSKKEKRRWRKKKSKMSPDEDDNSRDAAMPENSTSNFSTDPSSSITAVNDESSGSPKAVFSSVTEDKSSSMSQSVTLPVPQPVDEPKVTETVPEESPTKSARPSESDNWLDFDFGDDLDMSKGDNKDDDDLLREIDELLA